MELMVCLQIFLLWDCLILRVENRKTRLGSFWWRHLKMKFINHCLQIGWEVGIFIWQQNQFPGRSFEINIVLCLQVIFIMKRSPYILAIKTIRWILEVRMKNAREIGKKLIFSSTPRPPFKLLLSSDRDWQTELKFSSYCYHHDKLNWNCYNITEMKMFTWKLTHKWE